MEFLGNPVWQVAINVTIGLLTIIVSVMIFRKQIKRRGIAYEVVSDTPVLSVKEEIKGRVQVLFDNKPVHIARLVILKLSNIGNVDILPNEFIDPIKFDFGEDAEILDGEVLETIPKNIKDKVSIKLDAGILILEPLLLNCNESMTLKVLIAQTRLSRTVDASTRIIGLNQIFKFEKIRNRHPFARTVIYLSYLLLMASFIYLVLSKYESSTTTKLLLLLAIALVGLIYILLYTMVISLAYKLALKIPYRNALKLVIPKFVELIRYMVYETSDDN